MNTPAPAPEDRSVVASQFALLWRAAPLAVLAGAGIATGVALMVGETGHATRILLPAFALFLLPMLVLGLLAWRRIGGVWRGTLRLSFYRTFDDGAEPETVRATTRNFNNLFEMPMLFYAGLLIAYVTEQAGAALTGLAWSYVVLRYVHSYVHLTRNIVPVRLSIYGASAVMLTAFWAVTFAGILQRGG